MLLLLLRSGLPGVSGNLDGLGLVLVLDMHFPFASRSFERRNQSVTFPAASRHGASATRTLVWLWAYRSCARDGWLAGYCP